MPTTAARAVDPEGRNDARPERGAALLYTRVVEEARRVLTAQELAEVTGVKLRAVQNWASGNARPEGIQRSRLLETQYVIEQLGDVYDTEGIEIWMHRPNRRLEHRRPVDALRQGDFENVLRLVDDLAGGPRR
ncbi:antitoxin Xre/MbcA/ParS toxin-binding domain-containing protein [uncultured Amnibacterium sp.]|uniref:antitoxin Xre/MbcA/ParS toxin-binding domain-containing protein n=1 Tax=uncultured Amnibacterium sp. TaxID=1631851 RepID=UPI0035CA82BF